MTTPSILDALEAAAEEREYVTLLTVHGTIGGTCRGLTEPDPLSIRCVEIIDPGAPDRGLPTRWVVKVADVAAVGRTDPEGLKRDAERIEIARTQFAEATVRAEALHQACVDAAEAAGIPASELVFRLTPEGGVQAVPRSAWPPLMLETPGRMDASTLPQWVRDAIANVDPPVAPFPAEEITAELGGGLADDLDARL